MIPEVVIATAETSVAHGGDRLLQLAAWMQQEGVRVEIVALGEGWDLKKFRAVAPTLVVDELRRRGPARPAHLLGIDRATAAIKSVRLRRWLRARRSASFLVLHPLAASLLRYLPDDDRRVIAGLPDETWTLAALRPDDRASLAGAPGWVVTTDEQAAEVEATWGCEARVLANTVDPNSVVTADEPDPGRGTVALVGTPDLWSEVDHTVEVAWQLHRRRPDLGLRWLVGNTRTAWLARHDAAHAGLGDVLDVVALDDPGALRGLGSLVRTGRVPTADVQLGAAVVAGLPVLDLAAPPFHAAEAFGPLAVEAVVDRIVEFADDPQVAVDAAAGCADRLPVRSYDHVATAILRMLGTR